MKSARPVCVIIEVVAVIFYFRAVPTARGWLSRLMMLWYRINSSQNIRRAAVPYQIKLHIETEALYVHLKA